jgi:hypothetical protein
MNDAKFARAGNIYLRVIQLSAEERTRGVFILNMGSDFRRRSAPKAFRTNNLWLRDRLLEQECPDAECRALVDSMLSEDAESRVRHGAATADSKLLADPFEETFVQPVETIQRIADESSMEVPHELLRRITSPQSSRTSLSCRTVSHVRSAESNRSGCAWREDHAGWAARRGSEATPGGSWIATSVAFLQHTPLKRCLVETHFATEVTHPTSRHSGRTEIVLVVLVSGRCFETRPTFGRCPGCPSGSVPGLMPCQNYSISTPENGCESWANCEGGNDSSEFDLPQNEAYSRRLKGVGLHH